MIEYSLTRSKRKTIGIIVKDGKVYVKAPMRMAMVQIQAFVDKNTEWILSRIAGREAMRERFSDVLEYKTFLLRGKALSVMETNKKRVEITDGTLLLPSECGNKLKNMLPRVYKKIAETFLKNRVDELSQVLNVRCKAVNLTNAKTKWGSCSSDGILRLNWRLVLLPDEITDYVLVHELCHTKELNHSKKFWELVEKYMPDYKSRRQTLKQFVPLIEYCR